MNYTKVFKRFVNQQLGVQRMRPTDPIRFKLSTALRHTEFAKLHHQVKDLPGNIVECGVGQGVSLFSWCVLNYDANPRRQIWAFDSFAGFPEPTEEDRSSRNPKAGQWGQTSIAFVKDYLDRSGIDQDTINGIHFVKGFFEDTLSQYDGTPIALLHLDVDLYASYKVCLETLFQHVVKGGVVIFDEYGSSKWPGATQAIDEFFGDQIANFHSLPYADKGYIFKA